MRKTLVFLLVFCGYRIIQRKRGGAWVILRFARRVRGAVRVGVFGTLGSGGFFDGVDGVDWIDCVDSGQG
jgi:hypothetical protein